MQKIDPEIKVTRINNRYHARLFYDEKVIDEMACEFRQDIGWICRELLRWFDKLSSGARCTQYAEKARHRPALKPSRIRGLHGKVWWKNQLEREKYELAKRSR